MHLRMPAAGEAEKSALAYRNNITYTRQTPNTQQRIKPMYINSNAQAATALLRAKEFPELFRTYRRRAAAPFHYIPIHSIYTAFQYITDYALRSVLNF
jgi:hypothetical protein